MSQPSSSADPARFTYRLPGGRTCRSWDDFLVLSSQHWSDLRDELVSGRLNHFLASIGRQDLMSHLSPDRSPDDRLDDWLAQLPTSRAGSPELDAHPNPLELRLGAGGGPLPPAILRISNVGYRILRGSVRIESASSFRIRLGSGDTVHEFAVLEGLELPVTIAAPGRLPSGGVPLGTLIVESNGGSLRIPILLNEAPLEHPAIRPNLNDSQRVIEPWEPARVTEWLARRSLLTRLVGGVVAALFWRALLGLADLLVPSSPASGLALLGPAILLTVLGGALGLLGISRRQAWQDLVAGTFLGMYLGFILAVLGVASERALESMSAANPIGIGLGWCLLGLGVAAVSLIFAPRVPEVPS